MRVLIVEDDPVSRRIISRAVRDASCIAEVDDGERAIRLLEEAHEQGQPFDLVVLDLELPSASGLEALRALRGFEEPKRLVGGKTSKVIIISGHNDPACIYDAHSLECDAYFVKPIDTRRLIKEVKRLTGQDS